ncbi:hypothetical protein ACFXJO_16275 [Streptomyces lavendulae]|uniref:hypothetical protein n=1 Tax=Streptomyces lavendulae TaxID=1914 RepID=UPI00367506AE
MNERIRDLNAGHLPRLTHTRPDTHSPRTDLTAMELFGCPGMFFTVPGTFPSDLPQHITHTYTDTVYAVLQTLDPVTGMSQYTVRDVDGHRLRLGEPHPRKSDAVRSALDGLALFRRDHAAQVASRRVGCHLPPVPSVRIGYDTGAYIVHIHCDCSRVRGFAAYFEHFSDAGDWLSNNSDPWQLCTTSPLRVITASGGGRITGTRRDEHGIPVVEVRHDGYDHPALMGTDEVLDVVTRA